MAFYQYNQVESFDNTVDFFGMGRDVGEQFADQVTANVTDYDQYLTLLNVTTAAQEAVVARVKENLASWAPEMLEEMEGLAAGSGCHLDEIVTLNSRTELLATATPSDGECSTAVLVTSDGAAPRTVQTWDWVTSMNQDMLVRRYTAASGRTVVTFAEFGQLAKIGLNSAGLGIHFNILSHQSDGTGSGVPVHLVAKRILDQASTVDEAIAIAEQTVVEASTVLTVVSRHPGTEQDVGAYHAACLELSPAGIAVLPAEPGTPLIHTNHFIDPVLAAGERSKRASTTHDRYDCAARIGHDVMAVSDPFQRAQQFTSTDCPIDFKPDPNEPWYQQKSTKATIVLDVDNFDLHYCAGSASRATADQWKTLSGAVGKVEQRCPSPSLTGRT